MADTMSRSELDETFLPIAFESWSTQLGAPVQDTLGQEQQIRVAGFEARSLVAGPGIRSVIWVAGCHRRCPGCSQPEFLSFNSGRDVSIDDLWELVGQSSDIEGVTFSGGEPFEQAQTLGVLARRVRQAGLSVVCYSGYRLEALCADRSRFGPLLDEIDLLIDGEFRASAAGNYRWRGSGNQRLICLTDRIALPPEEKLSEMQISFHDKETGISISGIWPPGVLKELMGELEKRGFSMQRDDTQWRSAQQFAKGC